VEVSGQKIVKSLLIRAANRKGVEQLSSEIKAAAWSRRADPAGYRSLSGVNGIEGAVTELHVPWLPDGSRSDVVS
jgi:hypothetical protein